jgi:hypothetical protein
VKLLLVFQQLQKRRKGDADMAKYLSKRDPFKFDANLDVIRGIQNLTLEEAIQWLGSGEILLDLDFNQDQLDAISYVTGVNLSKSGKADELWMFSGDECLTVKLSKYSRKDKPPFGRTKAEFILVTFSK